jgi:phosphatidylglycerophosphate synthase
MISNQFKDKFAFLLTPMGEIISRTGISPNQLTLVGMAFSVLAGVLIGLGHPFWGGILVILGGLCDALDGTIARSTQKVTRFGAFLDSTLDRYSDLALYLGVMALAFGHRDLSLFLWTALALTGATMVGYPRARAECLIESCQVGIMERPERVIILLVGLFFHWLEGAMVVTAILANLTALQRIYHTFKELKD